MYHFPLSKFESKSLSQQMCCHCLEMLQYLDSLILKVKKNISNLLDHFTLNALLKNSFIRNMETASSSELLMHIYKKQNLICQVFM